MAAIDEADLEWETYDHEETRFRRKELANAVDAEKLGCSLYELPPGARSWPYHYHTANEEALYVLAGDGQVRTPDGVIDLRPGSFVDLPADERGGHRVVNDGDHPLRYLVLSTMVEPDVTVYPEMGKFGVYVGSPPGSREERSLHGYYDVDSDVDYWES